MSKNILLVVGLIIIAAGTVFFSVSSRDAGTGTSTSTGTETETNTETGTRDFDRFASVSLVDYDGAEVSLEEFRGTPLVINSWAVWCPFCRDELPAFAELQKEFGDQVVVIAIDRQEPIEKAKGFTDELGITDDMHFLIDPSDAFYKSIGGFSMPETIFVNAAGDIVVHKRGPMELEEMRELTNKIVPQ